MAQFGLAHLLWEQGVGGSNPLIPTIFSAGIAQLARASAFQAEGRGFESRFPLHIEPALGINKPGAVSINIPAGSLLPIYCFVLVLETRSR